MRLDFSSGSTARLDANTTLTVLDSTLRPPESPLGQIRLDKGRIWVMLLHGALEVQTASGTARINGGEDNGTFMSVVTGGNNVFVSCLVGSGSLQNSVGKVNLSKGLTALAIDDLNAPALGRMGYGNVKDWLAANPEAGPFAPVVTQTTGDLEGSETGTQGPEATEPAFAPAGPDVTPTGTRSTPQPISAGETLQKFFSLVGKGSIDEALAMLDQNANPDSATNQAWTATFNSIDSVEVVSIDLAGPGEKPFYKAVVDVTTRSSIAGFSWASGRNTFWITLAARGANGWMIDQFANVP